MVEQPTPGKEANHSATVAGVPQAELSPRQRARLRRAVARLEADQRRLDELLTVILTEEGGSQAAVARELGISRQAVHDRLRRGQWSDQPKPSKKPR